MREYCSGVRFMSSAFTLPSHCFMLLIKSHNVLKVRIRPVYLNFFRNLLLLDENLSTNQNRVLFRLLPGGDLENDFV